MSNDSKEIIGVANGDSLLCIYEKPDMDSEIIAEVPHLSEIWIDSSTSLNEWYSVCTVAGIEGFCRKSGILIKA